MGRRRKCDLAAYVTTAGSGRDKNGSDAAPAPLRCWDRVWHAYGQGEGPLLCLERRHSCAASCVLFDGRSNLHATWNARQTVGESERNGKEAPVCRLLSYLWREALTSASAINRFILRLICMRRGNYSWVGAGARLVGQLQPVTAVFRHSS